MREAETHWTPLPIFKKYFTREDVEAFLSGRAYFDYEVGDFIPSTQIGPERNYTLDGGFDPTLVRELVAGGPVSVLYNIDERRLERVRIRPEIYFAA